jgi:hypothetical protein
MELPPVGQAVEVLFDTATGQVWTQGVVRQIGPIEGTDQIACWVEMQFTGYGATLPYTRDDFLVGMIRVVRVTRLRQLRQRG